MRCAVCSWISQSKSIDTTKVTGSCTTGYLYDDNGHHEENSTRDCDWHCSDGCLLCLGRFFRWRLPLRETNDCFLPVCRYCAFALMGVYQFASYCTSVSDLFSGDSETERSRMEGLGAFNSSNTSCCCRHRGSETLSSLDPSAKNQKPPEQSGDRKAHV